MCRPWQPLIQLARFNAENAGTTGGGQARVDGFNAHEEDSSPSARRDSGVQVAEAGGGWSNPTAWALEQAGRQAGQAVDKAAETAGNAPDVAAKTASDAVGKAAETALRVGAGAGRAVGLDMAADNLDHFLDGTGTDKVYTRDQARQRDFIREAEKQNQDRYIEGFLEDRGNKPDFDYKAPLLAMKDGETITVPTGPQDKPNDPRDTFSVNRGTLGHIIDRRPDEALAFGTQDFSSEAHDGFTATREGDTITMTGIVTHVWSDPYDFHGGSSGAVAGIARDLGGAREYTNKAEWQQELTVIFKVDGNTLDIVSHDWKDLPEAPR